MNIGFIGLGNMGSAMAGRLLAAGHTLTVWNRSPEAVRRLAEQGAQPAATVEEAFSTEVVLTMLSDDRAVRSTLIDSGVLARAGAPATAIHVNMATVSVTLSDELSDLHRARGIDYVAAPVLGRPDVAAAGKLNVLAAGPESAIERVQPLLELIGQKIWRFGERAARASVAKLAVNFMLAAAIDSMGEAAALGAGYGIEAGELFTLVSRTLFPGPVYEGYGRLIAESRFEPAGFKASTGLKDVRLVLTAADAVNAPMPLAGQIHDTMLEALNRGEADKEFGVVLGRAALRRAGR